MIHVRKAADRGHFNHGWLDSYHTFSFASYHDPKHMNFRTLRVMNEDRVEAGQGFGMHPHRDMEIVTYVVSGRLEHQDSMGNGSVIEAGEFQRMSAGTGVMHSEFNPSSDEPTHLYQIWILPSEKGLAPSYEEKKFAEVADRWRLVASPEGRDDAMRIHQDASLLLSRPTAGAALDYELSAGRHAWLQVIRGDVALNGERLSAGDGAAVSDQRKLQVEATSDAELLLFDLA